MRYIHLIQGYSYREHIEYIRRAELLTSHFLLDVDRKTLRIILKT